MNYDAAHASSPQNEKKLSQRMINFIGSQGYNTNGLNSVTFYNGSLTAEAVRGTMGNPAITIGNSIHVASDSWSRISSPSGGASGGDNILKGAVNLVTGGVISKLLSPAIPGGYRTVSQRASDNGAKNVTSIGNGLWNAITSYIPNMSATKKRC